MGLQCFAARPIFSSTFATSRYADMLNRTVSSSARPTIRFLACHTERPQNIMDSRQICPLSPLPRQKIRAVEDWSPSPAQLTRSEEVVWELSYSVIHHVETSGALRYMRWMMLAMVSVASGCVNGTNTWPHRNPVGGNKIETHKTQSTNRSLGAWGRSANRWSRWLGETAGITVALHGALGHRQSHNMRM